MDEKTEDEIAELDMVIESCHENMIVLQEYRYQLLNKTVVLKPKIEDVDNECVGRFQ